MIQPKPIHDHDFTEEEWAWLLTAPASVLYMLERYEPEVCVNTPTYEAMKKLEKHIRNLQYPKEPG